MLVSGYNDLARCSHNKIKVKSETMFDYNDLARCSHNKPKVKSKTISNFNDVAHCSHSTACPVNCDALKSACRLQTSQFYRLQ